MFSGATRRGISFFPNPLNDPCMLPTDYCQLVDALHAPPPRCHLPFDDRHPDWHHPPRDPPPLDDIDCQQMLRRFPPLQRTVCAASAADMALPVWIEWAARVGYVPNVPSRDPRAGLRAVYRLLAGGGRWVVFPFQRGFSVRGSTPASADAHRAVQMTVMAVIEQSVPHAAQAVGHAARAWQRAAGIPMVRFYKRWWEVCRCRLAVRDVMTSPITVFGEQPLDDADPSLAHGFADAAMQSFPADHVPVRRSDPVGPLILSTRRPLPRERLLDGGT